MLAPLATFGVFVISADSTGRTLNTASAYTALSLISLLARKMINFLTRYCGPVFNCSSLVDPRNLTFFHVLCLLQASGN